MKTTTTKHVFSLGFALVLMLVWGPTKTIQAQEVNYKVVSNDARPPRLQAHLIPISVAAQNGVGLGWGAMVTMRPINRIRIQSLATTNMYLNDYRMNYDGPNPNGFKSLGGLNFDATAEYIWRRKGAVIVEGGKGKRKIGPKKFILSKTSSGGVETTKYINYKYNILIERSLRAGLFFDDFSFDGNTNNATALSAGIGKRYSTRAELDFNGMVMSQSHSWGWAIDVMVGFADYDVKPDTTQNYGARFILERNQVFSRHKGLFLHSYNLQLEAGFQPGNAPPYLAMRLGIPLFTVKGNYITGINYKERKRIGRL